MLAVGIPNDAVLWRTVDGIMEQHLRLYGEEFGFFCCHVLGLALDTRTSASKTHLTLLDLVLNNKTREQQAQPTEQVQASSTSSNTPTTATEAITTNAEYAIEQLSLRMRFMSWGAKHMKYLANGKKYDINRASKRNTAYFQLLSGGLSSSTNGRSGNSNSSTNSGGGRGGAAMSQRALEVLSLSQEPVSLHSLSDVWMQSPKLNLNNTYRFYKSLYEKVLHTLEKEPFQLTDNKDPVGIVTSLLEAMVKAKHKYSKLEHEVLRLLSGVPSNQSEYDQYGIRLFSACIKLDNIPVALAILQNVLNNSSGLEYAFAKLHQTSGSNGAVLSDKAKENIYNYLSSPSIRGRGKGGEGKETIQMRTTTSRASQKTGIIVAPENKMSSDSRGSGGIGESHSDRGEGGILTYNKLRSKTSLVATPAVSNALKVFSGGVANLAPAAYAFQGYKYNRAIMLPTVTRVTQAIVGEMSTPDAVAKIRSDMMDAVKEAKK